MNKLLVSCALLFSSAACFAQRLPGNVIPDHYTLKFSPDLVGNSFTGDETIDVEVKTPTTSIVLNAVEINFKTSVLRIGGKELTATVTPNPDKETVTLQFPSEVPTGRASLHITYVGQLNDKLRGMYRSDANHRKYVITQFEAVDARVAFPSFDEPAFKATFDISATVDTGDTAISNGRIVSDEPAEAGKHTIRFSTTPKMSTYLVALTVGDWKCVTGEEDGIPLRVCSVPGKEDQGKFALEATKAILHFYDQYFSIKYPYGKLDQVAAPDFEAGAMENTGAIIYRESDLLLDERKASVNDEKEVAMVIAHEMAHQWFGDLVTMKWWDDVWLNEGFATWMETKPVAAWKPEWKISQDEVLTSQRSLQTDSAQNTRPIHHSAEGRQEINSLFDGIAYGKTSAVLRMLEGFLGREEFRRGVNSYIQAHSYSNATAQDFWGAMAAASGRPIDRIMPTFVTQPGVPYVDLQSKCVNGKTVATLSQRRFIASAKAMQGESTELWQLPLLMKEIGGNGGESREVLSEKQQEFQLAGCGLGVFPNVNGAGYYRYSIAPSLLAAESFKVQDLSEEDQVSLVGNEGALLSAGLHHIQDVMTLAAKFRGVETEGAIEELGAQVQYANRYLVTDRDRAPFRAWVEQVFKPTLQMVGTKPQASEPPSRSNVRADLVGILGDIADDPDAIALAKQTVESYMHDPTSVDATLVDSSFPVAAAHGDAALYDAFLHKTKSAGSPQDYYRYFNGLAQFRDPALLKRTLQWALGPDVRNQDLSIILRILYNPYGQRVAWDFIRERYGDIQKKAGESIVGAQAAYLAVGAFCDAKSLADAQSFLEKHKVEGMDRVGRQQVERVDQCIDLRQREEPNLSKFLESSSTATGQH